MAKQRWNDWSQLDAQLIELWADFTLTAQEIGERLGVTRNAVIGRAHRLNLAQRQNYPFKPAPEPEPPPAKIAQIRASKARSHAAPRPDPPPEPPPPPPPPPILIEDLVEPPGAGLTLVELEFGQCKWPINAPPRGGGYLFCGEPVWPGERAYCGFHFRVGTAGSSGRPFHPGNWR